MQKIACAILAALALSVAACAPKKAAVSVDPSAKGLSQGAATDYYFLLYQELSRKGQPREAALVLEKLIELAPSPDLYRDLANLYWGLGDPEKTREVLAEGLKKFPDEKILHFYQANSYLLQRRFDEAIAILKNYLATHPKDQTTSQELGAVYMEAGRFQETLDFLAQVPREKRTPAMAYYEAKALAGLNKRKQAMDKLHQALREDPNLLAAWSELAYLHEQAGELRQAEEAYRRIMDLGEDGPEVWTRLIRLAIKEKNEAKAIEFLEKAPADRTFLFEVMGMFVDAGYQQGAAKVLERLAQDQPGNPDVLFLQAMIAVDKEKNLEKAFTLLSQIPKGHKYYDKSLTTRIQLALDAGQPERAWPLIREGRETYPDRIEFWFFEAIYHDKKGDLAKSAEVYREAAAKWPGSTEALYRYGVALERMKNREESLKVMERILTLEPGNPDALNFVGYALAEDGRDLDRALDLVSKALLTSPENPYYIDSLAWVHFKRGDLKKAWAEIQRAVAKPMEDPAIWEHYGDIAKAMGNRKDAAKGYSRALEMGASNAGEIKGKLDRLK
ncbi:tetratricopeptide repeat protein [Fundidesulfovibrio terrae]|uniref:tetratricopeptide repeat protein n=1 Tax=Fundidesulfovibrio terrae TaxID=2922866 RepID=UPI001FAEB60C|nr:tetratricopeptide repeat protein [Fundidesulfovibrio terrae]